MRKILCILLFFVSIANISLLNVKKDNNEFPLVGGSGKSTKGTRLKDYPYVNLDITREPGQEYGPGVELYTYSSIPDEDELKDVEVPVPRDCRILNTKGNCVWCSLELLARYAYMPQLYNITKNVSAGGDPRCQGGSSPSPVRSFLNDKKIKYEMYTDREQGEKLLIKACKVERRGAAFAIPGHMLNCIHYDPDTKIIKIIDNADRSLSVQTWSWEKFHRLWAGGDHWVYAIYGEPDRIQDRYLTLADQIPILDRNAPQGKYPKGYIIVPKN
jgi:hypothetical protein